MSGNLCRCTGYMGIVDAIERVMAEPHAPRRHPGAGRRPQSTARVARPGTWPGPAPGPVASRQRSTRPAAADQRCHAASRPPRRGRAQQRAPIHVTVGAASRRPTAPPASRQSFVLPHPRDAVWRADVRHRRRSRAACPASSLDGPPQGDKVAGRLEAKIGPDLGELRRRRHARARSRPSTARSSKAAAATARAARAPSGSVDYRLSALAGDDGRRGNARRRRHQLRARRPAGPDRPLRPGARPGAPHRRGLRAEPRRPTWRSGGRAGAGTARGLRAAVGHPRRPREGRPRAAQRNRASVTCPKGDAGSASKTLTRRAGAGKLTWGRRALPKLLSNHGALPCSMPRTCSTF